MIDEKRMEQAGQVYKTLCDAIERRGWTFNRDDERLMVHFTVSGEDIPMKLILVVDAGRQVIRLLSPLPFSMSEEKRMEGAIAACVASFGMADGSFDYDLYDGKIVFRMTASFMDSTIGEELLQYMISCSCAMVDKYNDQFLAIDKGLMSIDDFIARRS